MARNTATVTGPAYHRALLSAECLSESVREFRRAVLHVGNRLPLDGRRDMLAEKRTNPLSYMVKLFVAGKHAGMTRGWALRLVAWQRLMVDRLWSADTTSADVLEEREQSAENRANALRLRYAHQMTVDAKQKWLDAEEAEVAESLAFLAAHGRQITTEELS